MNPLILAMFAVAAVSGIAVMAARPRSVTAYLALPVCLLSFAAALCAVVAVAALGSVTP